MKKLFIGLTAVAISSIGVVVPVSADTINGYHVTVKDEYHAIDDDGTMWSNDGGTWFNSLTGEKGILLFKEEPEGTKETEPKPEETNLSIKTAKNTSEVIGQGANKEATSVTKTASSVKKGEIKVLEDKVNINANRFPKTGENSKISTIFSFIGIIFICIVVRFVFKTKEAKL